MGPAGVVADERERSNALEPEKVTSVGVTLTRLSETVARVFLLEILIPQQSTVSV